MHQMAMDPGAGPRLQARRLRAAQPVGDQHVGRGDPGEQGQVGGLGLVRAPLEGEDFSALAVDGDNQAPAVAHVRAVGHDRVALRARLRPRCGIVELSRQVRHLHRCVPLPVRPFFFIACPHTGHFFALLDGFLTPSSPPPGAHHFPRGEKDMPTRVLVQGQTSIISTTKVPISPN